MVWLCQKCNHGRLCGTLNKLRWHYTQGRVERDEYERRAEGLLNAINRAAKAAGIEPPPEPETDPGELSRALFGAPAQKEGTP